MCRKLLPAILLLLSLNAGAQYKNDNVLFKTVDWNNLCASLRNNKGYLLLDVRSAGEYADTSSYAQFNIGHLKGAVNINVRELGKRLGEIAAYKNKPVFVYCSHSQRSRRAGKMLSDSGFTNVFNINAGMTALYYSNATTDACLASLLVTANKYRVVSSGEVCRKLSEKANNIMVLDVRSDSAFRHISRDAKENAYGTIRRSVNIPLAELEAKLPSVPRNKEIIVIDMFGSEAAKAAYLLKEKGYDNVSMLIEGMDRWLSEDDNNADCKRQVYASQVSYTMMNTAAFGRFVHINQDCLLLDTRSVEEFDNKHKDSWRNIGHLKKAINIPATEIAQRLAEISSYKNKPVLLYGFSADAAMYDAANTLVKQGFTKVHVLVSGLFDIRWTATNNNMAFLKELVTDVPEENL